MPPTLCPHRVIDRLVGGEEDGVVDLSAFGE